MTELDCALYTESEIDQCVFRDNFNIIHHNIRSFNANYDEFEILFDESFKNLSVCTFTETWFCSDSCTDIDGFSSYHTFRSDRKGGGVSVFVRQNFKSRKLQNISFVKPHIETCIVEITITKNYSFILAGVYRPPHSNVRDFFNAIEDLIENFLPKKSKILFLGDFNVDISEKSHFGLEISNIFHGYNFKSMINKPTRLTRIGGNSYILDHIWTNIDEISSSAIIECDVTDHFITFACFKLVDQVERQNSKFRNHSAQTLDNFSFQLSSYCNQICIDDITSGEAYDSMVSNFCESIYGIYNECCPMISKTITSNRHKKPWINSNLIQLVKFKHFLYNDLKNKYIPAYVYKNFKNNVNHAMQHYKDKYIKVKFSTSRNVKTTWENLNKFVCNKKLKSKLIPSISHNGSYLESNRDKAMAFNNYFSDIAKNLDKEIPTSYIDPIVYLDDQNSSSFFVIPTTYSEVNSLILSFKNKSCSPTEIPVFLYKQEIYHFAHIISIFFNLSVKLGVFPSFFKQARLVPIHKKDDNSMVSNYRPISILPFLSKIFEKLMKKRLTDFVEKI